VTVAYLSPATNELPTTNGSKVYGASAVLVIPDLELLSQMHTKFFVEAFISETCTGDVA
jgi:hypothetical protein